MLVRNDESADEKAGGEDECRDAGRHQDTPEKRRPVRECDLHVDLVIMLAISGHFCKLLLHLRIHCWSGDSIHVWE